MTRPPPGIEQPHMLGEMIGGSLQNEFITRTDNNIRQRDLFPLPRFGADPIASKSLSRSCRRRLLSTAHWQNWANDGIVVLNEMGGKDSSSTCTATPSGSQSEVMSRIACAYSDVGKPDPGEVSATGALQALCGSAALYSAEAAPAPYAKELVSWPPRGAHPVPLDRIIAEADMSWLGSDCSRMLRCGEEAARLRREQRLGRPHSDGDLMASPAVYAEFIRELDDRGMLDWVSADGQPGQLGVFFVPKSNGKLRMVLDTRGVNTMFIDPPKTELPTPAAIASLETPAGHRVHLAQADIENAFYGMMVPPALRTFFSLPPVRAGLVKKTAEFGGSPARLLLPLLKVMPMGWNWSLYFCQSALMQAVREAGFSEGEIVADKRAGIVLSPARPRAAIGYVDNFAVISLQQHTAEAAIADITARLRAKGLPVHPMESGIDKPTFLGLEIDCIKCTVRIKPSRLWKLRFALDELLDRGACSSRTMESVLGHCTWASLLRREALGIFHQCYAFIRHDRSRLRTLWPGVRKELWRFRSLLPLLYTDIGADWHDIIYASDASPYGSGICYKRSSSSTAGVHGRHSERWRFQFDEAIAARSHALAAAALTLPDPPISSDLPDEILRNIAGFIAPRFPEFPATELVPRDWKVAHAGKWQFKENILRTEGRALAWGAKHALRSHASLGKRILMLVDNLPLALGMCKGRARSHHLRMPLLRISALSLASGCRFATRWIPSELNVADAPSRAWVPSKETDPPRPTGRRHGPSAAEGGGEAAATIERSGLRPPGGSGCNSTPPRRIILAARPVGSDLPGAGLDLGGDARRLPEPPARLRPMVRFAEPDLERCRVARPDPGDVAERSLLPRTGGCGGLEDGCRDQVRHAGVQSTGRAQPAAQHASRDELGQEGTSTPAAPVAALPSVPDRGVPGAAREAGHGPLHHRELRLLPPSEGGHHAHRRPAHPPFRGSRARLQVLGAPPAPSRVPGPRQGGPVRRGRPHRQRALALPVPGAPDAAAPGDPAVAVLAARAGRQLPHRVDRPAAQPPQPLALRTAPRRSQRRPPSPASNSRGCETPRTLGLRREPETLRQGDPPPVRARQAPRGRPLQGARGQRVHRRAAPGEQDLAAPLTDDEILNRLQRQFKACLREGLTHSRLLFLELFAGSQGLSSALRREGFGCLAFEIRMGPEYDLTNPRVLALIEGWITSRAVIGVWMGTPCASWSRARRGPPGSGWCAIRSNDHLLGLPDLTPADQLRIRLGNATARASGRLIRFCIRANCPIYLENPAASMLWICPFIKPLMHKSCCHHVNTDYCQFNKPWRKRTKIATWNTHELDSFERHCTGKQGLCSRTQRPHIVLTGTDRASGRLWTQVAEPYPRAFCTLTARHMVHAASRLQLIRRTGLVNDGMFCSG